MRHQKTFIHLLIYSFTHFIMDYQLKTIILPLLFSILIFKAQAQQELGLHFADDIWQASQTNPAMMNDHRLVIALPGVAAGFYHPAFSINDALSTRSGTTYINLDEVIPELEDNNQLFAGFQGDILGAAYRFGDIQVGASWSVRGSAYADYTREALDVLWNGNGGYIGETVNVATTFQFTAYNEIGISGAYNWRDKFSIGAKLKYLSGFSDLSTDRGEQVLSLETSDDVYQSAFTTDYVFRRAGFPTVDGAYDILNGLQIFNFSTQSGNTGFGFDVGITANLTDKLTLSASVIDLGSINWKTDTYEYTSRGKYNYGGLDLFSYSSADTLNTQLLTEDLEQIADDLTDKLDIRNTTEPNYSYTTALHTRGYLSGAYKLMDDLTLGALFYLENTPLGTQPGFAISGRKPFGKWVTLGASYAMRNEGFNNLGLNATGHFGPLQVYVVSDNIAAAINPYGSKNFNLRVGFNLVFREIEPPLE